MPNPSSPTPHLGPPRLRDVISKALALIVGLLLVVIGLTFAAAVWGVLGTSIETPAGPPLVDDVSQLNPIPVAEIITPTTTAEIVAAVSRHSGPIAVGGGRYSMGGQTATEGALQIDMRQFNRILAFDPARKIITVQSGVRWRQIQEYVDSAGLSVKIMQTYADFTVGGSLSVNVHGRYVGLGPLILSVRSLEVVLTDGTVVVASPDEHAEIFYGVVGGYGGLGVITSATLDLADNVRVRRRDRRMPITQYKQYFFDSVRTSSTAIFHNADIYPPSYMRVNALTYSITPDPVTVEDRLIPANKSYRVNRFMFWVISEWPFGKAIRQYLVDPILWRGEPVTWRNYEASYTVAELEPRSREKSTYVLQEYFIPVNRFDEFVPQMRQVLQRHNVNVINISVRHAKADPGSLLAWARTEVFAFVIYYKQGTGDAAREAVRAWTQELIEKVISFDGSYYLPYQILATEAQFHRAYPRAHDFFALKRRVDPTNKFRNKLWDRYYPASHQVGATTLDSATRTQLRTRDDYQRPEGQTYLTHPEWYIVYSSDEYAEYLKDRLPTGFPYVASIGQFWENYRQVTALTRNERPFNWGYHVMLMVIGTSYSMELTIKGLYENTVGRFTGWTAGQQLADEDRYAQRVAAEYGQFIHVRPWYEFDFSGGLRGLWTLPFWGKHPLRKWERKIILTLEYGVKAVYAGLIKVATRATYGSQEDRIHMVVTGWTDSLAVRDQRVRTLRALDTLHTLIAVPRYDVFRDVIIDHATGGTSLAIEEIAGNDVILLTGVAPSTWTYRGVHGRVLYTLTLPTDPSRQRFAMRVSVRQLVPVVRGMLMDGHVTVDHIYDY